MHGVTRMRFLVVALVACALVPQTAGADAVWGTGLAWEVIDPQYEGYWEYCYHIYWDTTEYGGHGLSHTTIYLALSECVCACDEGFFVWLVPAGLGYGEGDCEVDFFAEFDCYGDPHFPLDGPTMKFEPAEEECEPGEVGWVHVCYRSLFPPSEHQVFEDHLGIKFAQNVETGDLEGVLPACECGTTPAESGSWSCIKALYR
ncbi:MAG: hypothetical protein ABIE42_10465 [Candidatus Eisenbacteria bacterium]